MQVSAWLEEHGIADPWKLSANLVEAGMDSPALEQLLGEIPPTAIADVLARVNCQLAAAKLASEIKTATARISELVGAIKEYSYMDQASVQELDVHKGLENTLLILKYKLRKKNITVTRDYAESLPRIKAYGSELNQVWTNLIVNAVDAMSEGGTLKVRTKREPTDILVEIRDNGAGIPAVGEVAHLRTILHHQARRGRNRAGPGHRRPHRPKTPRQHSFRIKARRHMFPGPPPNRLGHKRHKRLTGLFSVPTLA